VTDTQRPGYLAIDVSPSRLTAGVVDPDGVVVLRDRVATPSRNVWPVLVRLVRRVLAANPSDVHPTAVGVTCPGPIDHGTGAMKPVGMPMWHDFPLRRELGIVTELPVHVDTAGRGLALAELWRGELAALGRGEQHAAMLALGDEVDGHLIVEPGGVLCPCGAEGCLTGYAGARGIEGTTGRELRRTPPAQVNVIGVMVARACASIAAMFEPRQIVIGGVVPEVLGEPFFESLAQEFEHRSGLSHLTDLRIRGVASFQIGPLIAAAAVARAVGDRMHAPGPDDADPEPTDGAPASAAATEPGPAASTAAVATDVLAD
jgi:glucokinase